MEQSLDQKFGHFRLAYKLSCESRAGNENEELEEQGLITARKTLIKSRELSKRGRKVRLLLEKGLGW